MTARKGRPRRRAAVPAGDLIGEGVRSDRSLRLVRMTAVRIRSAPTAFRLRFPAVSLAFGALLFAATPVVQVLDLWRSPIRGSESFDIGLAVGLLATVPAVAAWMWWRLRASDDLSWAWWQWTSALAWLGSVVVTGVVVRGSIAVSNAFLIGTFAYSVVAFIATGALITLMLARGDCRGGVRARPGSPPRGGASG